MNPQDLLVAARRLVEEPSAPTAAVWARSAAILTRQALELRLRDALVTDAPRMAGAPFTTQLLVLRALHPDDPLATRIAYTWSALSQATHFQGYELPPTAEALRGWIESVEEFVGDRERK